MKKRGEITVFLSLCLLVICALICVMLESARLAGSRFYFQTAVNASVDTLFSRYHRKLWEEYRILGMPFESEAELAEQAEAVIRKYLDADNWYPMELESVDVEDCIRLTDRGGDFFAKEVTDYMRCGIWSFLDIAPEEGGTFFRDIKEAAGAGAVADACEEPEKEVRKLEKTVEEIAECVKAQEKYASEIASSLADDHEEGFRRNAGSFRKEAGRMPGLTEKYDRQAEKLRNKLEKTRSRLEEVRPDLTEDTAGLLKEQMDPYETYIAQDGARRNEIIQQRENAERNLELLDETEALVEEARREYERKKQEQTETAGGEENSGSENAASGDQETDSRTAENVTLSLADAEAVWKRRTAGTLELEKGEEDQEKRGFLDQVKSLAQGSLLALVLPEGAQISDASFSTAGLPSRVSREKSLEAPNLPERVLIHEYCAHFFTNALSREEHPVQYEMEYLIAGQESDRRNLEETASQLLTVRQGLNLIHILSDPSKRAEAKTLAFTIVGATGIAPLVEITACFIMGVWAVGEAVMDLRILFSGGKVPLWKERGDWNLSLENLLTMGQKAVCPESSAQQRGLTYETYLKLLLFLTDNQKLQLRMLDLIEMNIQREETDFSVDFCAYQLEVCGKACGKHMFFALPFVENLVGEFSGYPLEAPVVRAY